MSSVRTLQRLEGLLLRLRAAVRQERLNLLGSGTGPRVGDPDYDRFWRRLNGYAAGLRNGQSLEGWSIHGGDVHKEVKLQVRVDGELQEISYYPRGAGMEAPQAVLAN